METLGKFKSINPFSLKENVFDMLQDEWMLITAGKPNDFNTMTAAWGGFGILWRKPIAIIYIRPQRYTYKYTEQEERFSLSFFGHKNHRKALSFCGSKSGRVYDKPKETGLTAALTPENNIAFQEARLVFDCKKLYADDIKPEHFFDIELEQSIYPTKDYHRFYIGEIVGCYEKSE
jgi:flavin reductase (DIM6/NTAB) family NADH-FMN oxidoreductase RutF